MLITYTFRTNFNYEILNEPTLQILKSMFIPSLHYGVRHNDVGKFYFYFRYNTAKEKQPSCELLLSVLSRLLDLNRSESDRYTHTLHRYLNITLEFGISIGEKTNLQQYIQSKLI